MAQKDAKIRNLEHLVEEKEREIDVLKESSGVEISVFAGRLTELEKRMVELEVLVKGLTEELLDMKGIILKATKAAEERRGQVPRVEVGKVVPAPKKEEKTRKPVAMIMQPDGTLKEEKRETEGVIIADPRKGVPTGQTSRDANKDNIIIGKNVYEKNNRPTKPVIFAKEEEVKKGKKE